MRALLALTAVALAGVLAPSAMSTQAADRGTVTVASSDYGKILFDGKGFVLYAFTKDTRNRTRCFAACAAAWPPYYVTTPPKAGAGVNPRLLGTIKRAGKLQVTYAGWPLYYYVGDRSPREIRCQNVYEFGGLWLVQRPTGKLVRS